MNPRGRLHQLTLNVGSNNYASQLEGELLIRWDYEDLGGLWRARLTATFSDSPGSPASLSWEDNASTWQEGTPVTATLGSDTLFEGRILSVTAPAEEAQYPGDWRVTIEAGDVLYYANYQNRDMGNYAETDLDGNKTLGEAIDQILDYAGYSLDNASSLTASCNFNLASRDQEGLVSGMAGALAYQQGLYVLAAQGATITAYQEDLTGSAHATYGIADTVEFAPIPDSEPLVEELEMISNTQQYVNQGTANYRYDNRINGEGFVGEGEWIGNNFVETLTEYRTESSIDPESNSLSMYDYSIRTVRVYNSSGYLTTIRKFAWGDLPLYFVRHIREVPSQARTYQISAPINTPSANEVWFLETISYTISGGLVTKITSTTTEVLCEQLNPRADRNITAAITNVGSATERWEIYWTETNKTETVIQKLGPKWYTKPASYDWQRNQWVPGDVSVSDDPTEPELQPRVFNGDIYSLETVEISATAPLSSSDPNPNYTDKKRVYADYAGDQTKLDELCNHYANIVKGRRRMWRVTVPYSSSLLGLIKLPGRRISWSPDAHNRGLNYLLVGAAIRLSERLSVIDLELLHLGAT